MMFTNANTKQPDMTTTIPKIGRKNEGIRMNVFDDFLRESDRLMGVELVSGRGEACQLLRRQIPHQKRTSVSLTRSACHPRLEKTFHSPPEVRQIERPPL